MGKHTAGPWSVIPYGGINDKGKRISGFEIGSELCRDGFHKIAKLETTKWSTDERENANLIAAAPDLLEALEKCVTRFEANLDDEKDMGRGSMTYLLGVCSEAINRARGQS